MFYFPSVKCITDKSWLVDSEVTGLWSGITGELKGNKTFNMAVKDWSEDMTGLCHDNEISVSEYRSLYLSCLGLEDSLETLAAPAGLWVSRPLVEILL